MVYPWDYSGEAENLEDRAFNFRYPGLNVDFMSYCMLQLVDNDKDALLNSETLIEVANKAFGVFFKHFASENVTSMLGGHIYQPIGEKLPWSLGSAMKREILPPYQRGASSTQDNSIPTERFTNATLSVPVEQLVMSPIAVFLCISILVFLFFTIIIIYTANRTQLKALPRDVDTLASTLAFVHGSEKLLDWARDLPETQPWYRLSMHPAALETRLMARLGQFVDSKGKERWGIELIEPEPEVKSSRDESDAASHQEWIELQPQKPPEDESDDNGDLGTQVNSLGRWSWEQEEEDREVQPDESNALLDRQVEDIGQSDQQPEELRNHALTEDARLLEGFARA